MIVHAIPEAEMKMTPRGCRRWSESNPIANEVSTVKPLVNRMAC
jgi:hypothetical protein